MKTTAISKPAFSWLTMQTLADKYHVRVFVAGHKVVLRADRSEDLVRIISVIKVLTS